MSETQRLLHPIDAAAVLAVTGRALSKMVRANEVPHIKLPNGEIRFRASDLDKWITEQSSGRGSDA